MTRPLHVALIGQRFMGRAHSNAWGQAGRFFDLPRLVVLDTVAAREAGDAGLPIIRAAPDSESARALRAIPAELHQRASAAYEEHARQDRVKSALRVITR